MEYSFAGEWNDKNKALCENWIRTKLTEIQGSAPEDLFLEYIKTMVGNAKTMEDISTELVDFLGEDISRSFAGQLGEFLRNIHNVSGSQAVEFIAAPSIEAASSKSGKINLKSTASLPMQSLSTGRTSKSTQNSTSESNKGQGGRLLQTAIRSSVSEGGKQGSSEVDRKLGSSLASSRSGNTRDSNSDYENKKRKGGQQNFNEQQDKKKTYGGEGRSVISRIGGAPNESQTQVFGTQPQFGSTGEHTAMLDRMQTMAHMWGFRSAEEMLQVQQATMMQIMAASAPGMFPPYPHHNQPPSYHPQGNWRGRGGGRNYNASRPPVPPNDSRPNTYPPVTGTDRNHPENMGTTGNANAQPASTDAVATHQEEPAATASGEFVRGGRGRGRGFASRGRATGRGGGRGRGYQGDQSADAVPVNSSVAASEATPVVAPATPSESVSAPSQQQSTWSGRGRGGYQATWDSNYRGRGFSNSRGRSSSGRSSGRVFANKTWVRDDAAAAAVVVADSTTSTASV